MSGAEAALPNPVPATVVVVSRHRPRDLALCLKALALQDHPAFAVVIVADPSGLAVQTDLPVHRIGFDEANISAARNLGIRAAVTPVVAFIDDDAIAEPGWLSRLTAGFADPRVIAATGYVRGPNGLDWQARAERVTRAGTTLPITVTGDDPVFLPPDATGPISTMGTNCAFRRDVLMQIGGFDPAFRFHLDETDLNMRLAALHPQALTAVVPLAEVAHRQSPSPQRTDGRAPTDLGDIGRSAALFWRRWHAPPDALLQLKAAQRRRLLRSMVAGTLDPFAVAPALKSLDAGIAGGAGLPLELPEPLARLDEGPPRLIAGRRRQSLLLDGWLWQAAALRARAAQLAAAGNIVTLLLLTPGATPHRSGLVAGGWWEQRGGIWGASGPDDQSFVICNRRDRVRRELHRIARVRDTTVAGEARPPLIAI
ncbi:glycosyltransferase family 2 protein [Paracoccus pacificus]|uniref:Glycosyltransferase family 2 protein n=1 Tax=Paracoccus pacificus TaxID=1463598 RepID=A0ABW4R2S9_9RHOB